ncbi:MAG: amidase [Gammaproteobacteria bacterium]|nr:amidase [Gammaproteobacteria bacterium]
METLTELASHIHEQRMSPSELLERTFTRIEEHKELNSVVALNRKHAQASAAIADRQIRDSYRGPLHGIPVTIKDTFATTHIPTTFGMPIRYRCKQNAEVVTRLQNAGAIIIGKTNLPAMSFDWQARHPRYGQTRHPSHSAFSPGGSSGGSAAALAAGIVPFEVGSDIAGSLRVPAAFCGVKTLRPTEGTISLEGHMAVPMSRPTKSLLTAGPMARNYEDLKLVFSVISDLKPPEALSPLKRILVQTEFPGVRVERAVLDSIQAAIAKLKDAGIEIVNAESGIDFEEALRLWSLICGYELKASSPLYMPRFLKPMYRAFFERRYSRHLFSSAIGDGMAMSHREYLSALERRKHFMADFDRFLESADLLLTPVSGIKGMPLCKTGSDLTVNGVPVPYAEPLALLNCSFALFGHPVAIAHAKETPDGFPVGMQLHGRRFSDYQLLEHAARVEKILRRD